MSDVMSRNPAGRAFVPQEYILMSIPNDSPNFVSRIFQNDAAKKGVAGAIAGILVAVVSEALWPGA